MASNAAVEKHEPQPVNDNVIEFKPGTETAAGGKRWRMPNLFVGTSSFWKLVGFLAIIGYGAYLLSGGLSISLVRSGANLEFSYIWVVYGITAIALGISTVSMLAALSAEGMSMQRDKVVGGASLVALGLAAHFMSYVIPNFVEFTKFESYNELYVGTVVSAILLFGAAIYCTRVWKASGNHSVGAWLGGSSFVIASVIFLRWIA